jgi:hypothetical protein
MVDDELTSTGGLPDPVDGALSVITPRSSWEFLEILAAVILAAESLRIVGSVTSGLIYAATAHAGAFGNQQLIGSAMERVTNFSDGPGIVLLLISLALVWWRAEYWTARINRSTAGLDDAGLPAEAVQAHRLGALARWTTVLFSLAGVGAIAFLIGDILVNTAGGVPTSDQWQALANGTFSIAYTVIALAALVASIRLARLCRVDARRLEASR